MRSTCLLIKQHSWTSFQILFQILFELNLKAPLVILASSCKGRDLISAFFISAVIGGRTSLPSNNKMLPLPHKG